jgi:hypothetical protein
VEDVMGDDFSNGNGFWGLLGFAIRAQLRRSQSIPAEEDESREWTDYDKEEFKRLRDAQRR